jgi:hypothetical protein
MDDGPKYFMTELYTELMTSRKEAFLAGVTAYLNAVDFARQQRKSAVDGANNIAREMRQGKEPEWSDGRPDNAPAGARGMGGAGTSDAIGWIKAESLGDGTGGETTESSTTSFDDMEVGVDASEYRFGSKRALRKINGDEGRARKRRK